MKFEIYSQGGAIALDEFNAINGPCPSSEVCDFESGPCGWILDNSFAQYAFKLIGAYEAKWDKYGYFDKFDHSTDTYTGHFLEASDGIKNYYK